MDKKMGEEPITPKSGGKTESQGTPKQFALAMALFFISVWGLYIGIQREILKEKFVDAQENLNIIARPIEDALLNKNDWYTNHDLFLGMLNSGIQELDDSVGVFAAAYNINFEEIRTLSNRNGTYETLFDPFQYAIFAQEVIVHDKGTLKVNWGDPAKKISMREMNLCYRWVPLVGDIKDRHLLVAGVSKFSIKSQFIDGVVIIVLMVLVGSVFASIVIYFYIFIGLFKDAKYTRNRNVIPPPIGR